GQVMYSHAVNAPGETLYGVGALYYAGLTMDGIAFGPAGSAGAAGDPGQRGSKHFYASGSSWSDTTANNAITAAGLTRVLLDKVTISNTGFAETRVWNGSAWEVIAETIDGALLVDGTIGATKLGIISG